MTPLDFALFNAFTTFAEFPLPDKTISKSDSFAFTSIWCEYISSNPISLPKQVIIALLDDKASTFIPGYEGAGPHAPIP